MAHITFAADGGAGRAAKRAHEACRAAGLDSFYIAATKAEADRGELKLVSSAATGSTTEALASAFERDLQWDYVLHARTRETNSLFSIPYPAFDLAEIELIRSCDIVHLHWVSWLASPRAVRKLLDAGKQVVWTLHDFWPMTGGCHYPGPCEQFKTACSKCPQLDDAWQLVPNLFGERRTQYGGHPNLTIVTPSRWLGDEARASGIFRDCRVEVLPNALDVEVFRPAPEREALRAAFGIAANDVVFAFGNDQNSEARKGGPMLRSALQHLQARWPALQKDAGVGRLVMVVFGKGSTLLDGVGVATLPFDQVSDDSELADILSLADAYVHPASQDNYPNTIIEAFACGVPSVAFPIGGLVDTIADGVTGYLADMPNEPIALADAMERFVRQGFRDPAMRQAARSFATATNSYAAVGATHAALYDSLLASTVTRPSSSPAALARATRLMANVVAAPLLEMGDAARRFPLGAAFGRVLKAARTRPFSEAELEEAFDLIRAPALPRTKKISVLAVRTSHRHHSAFSGPHHFLRHLPSDEFEIEELVSPLGNELGPDNLPVLKEMVRVSGAKGFANIGNALVADLAVVREATRRRFDIIHFIDGDIAGWLASSAARRAGWSQMPKFVATLHQPESVLADLISIPRLGVFDRIIALCEPQRRFIASLTPADRVEVIPHGIHHDFFVPANRPPDEIGLDRPLRLVAVGQWLRDYETLFAAMHVLESRGAPVRLDIVGGPAAAPDGLKSVRLHRGIDDDALRALYQEADALCLPLIDSTANNTLLESLASGLPVIITDVGGTSECATTDCAIFVRLRDPSSVVAAVNRLIIDPQLRAQMGRAARERALAFGWDAMGRRHADLYRQLVAR